MLAVFKYELLLDQPNGAPELCFTQMPKGAHVLHVAFQLATAVKRTWAPREDRLFVWALCDTTAPQVRHHFVCRVTGRRWMPPTSDVVDAVRIEMRRFIGTAVTSDGAFVIHVFDGNEASL